MCWNVAAINTANPNYLSDKRLTDKRSVILVTYETLTGRRYVKQVESNYGHISKKLGGNIIAWMPLPSPYRGESISKGEQKCKQ